MNWLGLKQLKGIADMKILVQLKKAFHHINFVNVNMVNISFSEIYNHYLDSKKLSIFHTSK